MNIKILSIIAVITVSLLIASRTDQLRLSFTPEPEQSVAQDRAFSFMNGVRIVSTDEKGKTAQVLKADSLRHYRFNEQTTFNNPDIRIYQNQQPQWKLTSLQGVLFGDQLFTLSHKVHVVGNENSDDYISMTTEEIHYEINAEKLYTSLPVEVIQKQGNLKATGMETRIPDKVVELKSRVLGYYEPAQ